MYVIIFPKSLKGKSSEELTLHLKQTPTAVWIKATHPWHTDSTEHNRKYSTKRHMELCIVELASEIGGEKMNYSPADMEPTR